MKLLIKQIHLVKMLKIKMIKFNPKNLILMTNWYLNLIILHFLNHLK